MRRLPALGTGVKLPAAARGNFPRGDELIAVHATWSFEPMRQLILAGAAALAAGSAAAQGVDAPSITFYELPAYLGRSVTVSEATPDLIANSIVRRAQSARVEGAWTLCSGARYRGQCRELAQDTSVLRLSPAAGPILSLRPSDDDLDTADDDQDFDRPSSGAGGGAGRVALDELDVDAGVEGQDVAFFARPSFGNVQVAAGTNERAAGDAFCRQAGYASSINTGRARVQASNLIDPVNARRVRSFALRDVLCRR